MLEKIKAAIVEGTKGERTKLEKSGQYMVRLLNRWNNKAALASVIILKLVMDCFFVQVVANLYGYYDYYSLVPNAGKYILSWVICLLLWKVMPKEESIKTFFLHLQFIITILPMLTLYGFTPQRSTKYMLLVTVAILIEALILTKKKKKYRPIRIKNLRGFTSVWFMFFIPLMLLLVWTYGGFSGLEAFDLNKLYEIRENAQYPAIVSYITSWLTITIIPFYIVYSLDKRKYIMTGILLLIDIFLYMILAHKMIYLSLVVIVGVYISAQSKHLVKLLYIGMIGLLVLLTAMFLFEKKDVSTITLLGVSFVGNRFLFVSATNKFFFYDFFSQYPKMHFADGMIGKMLGIKNLYAYSTGQMIHGFVTEGGLGMSNSNTGYLGDGYAQAGVLGIIICSIILACIVDYISNYDGKISFAVLASMIALYVVVLADVPLTTVLLTSGLFIFIILLAIYAKENEEGGK